MLSAQSAFNDRQATVIKKYAPCEKPWKTNTAELLSEMKKYRDLLSLQGEEREKTFQNLTNENPRSVYLRYTYVLQLAKKDNLEPALAEARRGTQDFPKNPIFEMLVDGITKALTETTSNTRNAALSNLDTDLGTIRNAQRSCLTEGTK